MSRLTILTETVTSLLAQIQAEEGYCPLCKSKVGNNLPCNDGRHKSFCMIPKARQVLNSKGKA